MCDADLHPGGRHLCRPQWVTISTTTSGATIRYTTDGTTPTETVGTVYSSPVSISAATATLQAIAYASGMSDSAVASGAVYHYLCRDLVHRYDYPGLLVVIRRGIFYGSNGYVLCAWNGGTDVVNLTGSYVQSVTPSGRSN